ncbi:MAG: Hsp33 family molecular chaperone HslO [Oxalobacteraceae bacterium]|nr:Hsp33 family molecular chaperone HslO [Oxalobacteraceae bacterium]
MFENSPVRGELIEISEAWQQVQSRRSYPAVVSTLLGEMMAAAALLSANLKFDGAIIMQIHGDGPVQLLVAECDAALRLRATAKLREGAEISELAGLQQLVNAHGEGRFAITLDPTNKKPGQQAYQGIVALEGESVATVIENYMMRSEQLDTRLWLAADDKVARGLLLQKLPDEGGKTAALTDADVWNRTVTLASTLNQQELLGTDIMTLLQRLYWEETVRVFDPRHPTFHCGCTREKVGNMLKMLGREEIDSALADLGKLDINCDFCGQDYLFDPVDCMQLFALESIADAVQLPTGQQH